MKQIRETISKSKFALVSLLVGSALTVGGLSVTYAAGNGSLLLLTETPIALRPTTTTSTAVQGREILGQQEATTGYATDTAAMPTIIPAATPTNIPATTPVPADPYTFTAIATPTPEPVQAASNGVPDTVILAGSPSLAQSYSLSCEYAAASAVTLYWGNQVTEDTFLDEVPTNPNPHLGFRGDINGAFGGLTDYGVYAEALEPVLEARGYNASTFYGGVNTLKANIAAGNPVVVWITTGKYTPRTPIAESYDGDTFTLVAGEHAVVVYGYDSGGVYIMDVASGNFVYTEWTSFLTRWSYFDQMALVITPK